MSIKLVAADAHPVFLLGLTKLFANQEEIELSAYCVTAAKAREAVRQIQPDILMLDLNLPDEDNFQLIRDLQQNVPDLKIILLAA